MSSPGSDFYACWRLQCSAFSTLREAGDAAQPPERLLQAIWHHQRLLRERLVTRDGRALRILHPGFWNHESGPDFKNAIIQFNDEPACSGDIEIDMRPGDWRSHAHHQNPEFKNVILHVIWHDEKNPANDLPALVLKPFLDAPVHELSAWLDTEASEGWPDALKGQCSAPLRGLPSEKLEELLRQAALVRLQRKANDLDARARQSGWEQALWESLFRALGYKHNVWPMQRLAELLPRFRGENRRPLDWQATLLGVGGLLPGDVPRNQTAAGSYLRTVWDIWWREQTAFDDCALPRNLWRFGSLRPANHPQRRLALASHWLTREDFAKRLDDWFRSEKDFRKLRSTLLPLLQVRGDTFWSHHWTFRSARLAKPQPLLGEARATDLAINVLLPWFWTRAVTGRNESLKRKAEEVYLEWPAGEDNAVLRLARQRLLGDSRRRLFRTAAMQQGLLQVVRDFCHRSDALCAECRFPELVRRFHPESSPAVQ